MRITKFAIPEILFGRGSMAHVGACAVALGGETVFLVSDPGLAKAGWLDVVRNHLAQAGLASVEFLQVQPNPRDGQVHAGAALYRESGADVIVAVGGGSPMDTAKGIGILVSNGGNITDYEGANRVTHPLPPMLFLPTTAGSGSDLSQFAIITDVHRKLKMSLISRSLIPNISIIDPDFLQSAGRGLLVDSCIDALAHAVESFISTAASPFTETQARLALRLWNEHAERGCFAGEPAALEGLCLASAAASMSFSNASLGVGHALAHAFGGRFDMPHGGMHAILLPVVLRFNAPYSTEKTAEVLGLLFPDHSFTTPAAVEQGIALLYERFSTLGAPVRLGAVLPPQAKEQLPELCQAAVKDACMLTNPRPAGAEQLLEICQEAW